MVDDDRLTGAEAGAWFDFFISRTASDAALGLRLSDLLNAAGYATLLQDESFGHDGFMGVMPEALTRGARVIALLSDAYLADPQCMAEAEGALAGDPRNRSGRLILLKAADCAPVGLIGRLRMVDIAPGIGDDARLAEIILSVVGHEFAGSTLEALESLETAPRQLLHSRISAHPGFVGRSAELQSIDRAFQGPPPLGRSRIVVLQGKSGVGLSSLARHYAFSRRDRFSGVWWLEGDTPSALGAGLRALASEAMPAAGNAEEAGVSARAAIQRLGTTLGDPSAPWLLVCDGPAAADLMADWRPQPGIAVLATGPLSLAVPGATALEVSGLPVSDAAALLKSRLPGRTLAAGEAESIAAALGGLPLSVTIAAATLASDPASSAESYLAGLQRHHEEPPAGAAYDRRFRATLWHALETAEASTEEAGAVLALASLLAPNSIPIALFELAADRYPEELQPVAQDTALRERVFGVLERLALIGRNEADRTFSIHPLAQQALRHALGGEAIDARWLASAAGVLDEVFPDPAPSNAAHCDSLIAHVLAVAGHAGKSAAPALGRLLNVCGLHLSSMGETLMPERLYRQALEVVEGTRGPIHPDLAATLINLGAHLTLAGRLGEAAPMLERALAIARSAFGAEHPDTLQIKGTLERLRALPATEPPPLPVPVQALAVAAERPAAEAQAAPVVPQPAPAEKPPVVREEPKPFIAAVPDLPAPRVLRVDALPPPGSETIIAADPQPSAEPDAEARDEAPRRRSLLDRLWRRD